jgi:superfamily I DNA/RNA helicase
MAIETLKVFGAPGCGKTFKLLELFEKELKETAPDRIAFVTFTRAARAEVLSRTSLVEDELPYIRTLHSLCYRLLKVHHEDLVSPKDLKEFGKKIGVVLTGYMPELTSLDIIDGGAFKQPTKADRLLQLNHLGRHRGLKLRETLRDAPVELDFAFAKWFTEAYRDWKTQKGLLDYTDLLTEYLNRGPELDADILFVDESQDLSWLQWAVVRKLGRNVKRRYLSGDDDQTIFSWCGASAELFLTEPCDDYLVLPQSYRIPETVHRLSQSIIRRVRVRQPKEFRSRDVPGFVKPTGNLSPKLLNQGGTSLVLFRNHHRGAELSKVLQDDGVPFLGNYSPLSKRDVVLALEGWWRISKDNPVTTEQARAMVSFASDRYLQPGARTRTSGHGGEFAASAFFTVDALALPWYQLMPRIPQLGYLERAVQRYGWKDTLAPRTQLMSIHQSKGREADTVILDLEFARRTYDAYLNNPDDEHRVLYVAVTRTRERLYTLLPSGPMHYQL